MKKTRGQGQSMNLRTTLALAAGVLLASVCAALLLWAVNKFMATSILLITGM